MAPNLTPGTFKIVSLIEGNPATSVNLTLPGFQLVHLNGLVTTWTIKREGRHTYRLSVGPYAYTGVIDDKVTATISVKHNVEWIATYRERQDAYTIEPANDQNRGWTVPYDKPHAVVEIRALIEAPTMPPMFSLTQLFRFEAVNDAE